MLYGSPDIVYQYITIRDFSLHFKSWLVFGLLKTYCTLIDHTKFTKTCKMRSQSEKSLFY